MPTSSRSAATLCSRSASSPGCRPSSTSRSPCAQVFDHTTVATFAQVVERASQAARGAAPPTIGRVARQARRVPQTTDF